MEVREESPEKLKKIYGRIYGKIARRNFRENLEKTLRMILKENCKRKTFITKNHAKKSWAIH